MNMFYSGLAIARDLAGTGVRVIGLSSDRKAYGNFTRFCEVRPALQFEALLETMVALAADGKTNRKGMPNLLRLAVIANAHFDTVQLPFPPALLQRIGLALGAPVGKLFGFGATYEPSGAVAAEAA